MIYSQYVNSSNLKAIQYNSDTRIMAIRFRSGPLYYFYGTSKRLYDDILSAKSHGKAFWRLLGRFYPYRRID